MNRQSMTKTTVHIRKAFYALLDKTDFLDTDISPINWKQDENDRMWKMGIIRVIIMMPVMYILNVTTDWMFSSGQGYTKIQIIHARGEINGLWYKSTNCVTQINICMISKLIITTTNAKVTWQWWSQFV